MTTSSEAVVRVVDSAPLIYAALHDHPANDLCLEYLKRGPNLTSPLVLLEAKVILRRFYAVEDAEATRIVTLFAEDLLPVQPLDATSTLSAVKLADTERVDLTDAVLPLLCQAEGATLATDDRKFANAAARFGIRVERPVSDNVRTAITAFEEKLLPARGLPRTLHHIHHWIDARDPTLANAFRLDTRSFSRLP
jgi:predicted nucleic acid-binding protein